VLCVLAPEGAVVRLAATTDRGEASTDAPPGAGEKSELALDLSDANRLTSIIIEIEAGSDGLEQGWLNWLMLTHRRRLEEKLARPVGHAPTWRKHLKDESAEPTFTPAYGLLLDAEQLADLRRRHDRIAETGAPSPFVRAARRAQGNEPEAMIDDFVNFWNDKRHNRVRDHDKFILNHGLNAAIAGHLLQDKALLRLAARYALSIGMCDYWDDGFINCLPGGTWDHRCFVQSLCAFEVAGILDLAGECFTDLGRNFLLRRLAEEATGFIQYTTWKYDYIFGCNQLAWFTPGRMLALAVMHRHWPRVRPYLDIAYDELCDSMEQSILPDGGYAEGPMYFRCVGRDAGLGVYFYSRATGRAMPDLMPDAMRRCGDFAELLFSTDDTADMIPICDARPGHPLISQAIMAQLLPDSAWQDMLDKTMARHEGWPASVPDVPDAVSAPAMIDAALAWQLGAEQAAGSHPRRTIIQMPAMGPVASHRRLDGHWVKLFIQGNRAGAGHTHEDKGSFVLEFAGETFAVDPGTCDYSNPLAGIMKTCQRHSMLVPTGLANRPAPASPLPADVKPEAEGDDTAFRAEIDLTPGWESHYRHWRRRWDSPTPDTLTITDEYDLAAGDGVVFYWQTLLPVTLDGHRATITGQRGRVELTAPDDAAWTLEELPLPDGVQHRLALPWPHTYSSLTIHTTLHTT